MNPVCLLLALLLSGPSPDKDSTALAGPLPQTKESKQELPMTTTVMDGRASWPSSPPGPRRAMEQVVKIYGAGGFGRIEAYGVGILISSKGHILTVSGPMLEGSEITIVTPSGKRAAARLLATEPVHQLAILKAPIDNIAVNDPFERPSLPKVGDVLFALSNAYGIAAGDEPVSLQRGVLSAILEPNQPSKTTYRLDMIVSNPGSPGGALVDATGALVGVIAKERKDPAIGAWVNSAWPISTFAAWAQTVVNGKTPLPVASDDAPPSDRPGVVDWRGIVPLPDVVDKAPPFIDGVEPGSPAERAGLRPNDLVMYVAEHRISSLSDLRHRLADVPPSHSVTLVLLRDDSLIERTLLSSPLERAPAQSDKGVPRP